MGVKFVVYGSPVGAVRTTQKSKWVDPDYQRYANYKSAVVQQYLNAGGVWENLERNKPINYDRKVKPVVSVFCWFNSGRRPDCDNVFKAITDALFYDDSNVVGKMDYGYDWDCPRVEVEINYEQAPENKRPAAKQVKRVV